MHLAFMLSTAFSLWMLVDAVQRGLGAKWGWIIMIPFGEFAYFFAVKIHDFSPGNAGPARLVQSGGGSGFSLFKPAPPTIAQLRYRFEQSPSLDNRMSLAAGLYDAGDYAEAAEQLAEIVRADDTDEDAHYGLARCHLASDKHSEAEAELREVLRLKPSYADHLVWRELCELLEGQDRNDEAVDLLRELKRISPRLEHCLALGQRLFEQGQYREASQQLEEALLDYDHAPAHIQREARSHAQAARQLLGQVKKS
jgi:tetratricopeptide (TPR) repeat protein